MRLDKLLERLQNLVDENFTISMRVNVENYSKGKRSEVIIQHQRDRYLWTHFSGETLEEAMRKAIKKLRHPNKDYVDEDGKVWEASGSSVYGAEHIKRFLRK